MPPKTVATVRATLAERMVQIKAPYRPSGEPPWKQMKSRLKTELPVLFSAARLRAGATWGAGKSTPRK